eukprot:gene11840-13070_t
MAKDFYQILGLNRDCHADDIKKAYRKLALKFHPDKNKCKGAEEKFKEISEAYDVLSDQSKRELFDRYGVDGLNGDGFHFPRGGTNNTSSTGAGGFDGFHFSDADARDTFSRFFGGEDPFKSFFDSSSWFFGDSFGGGGPPGMSSFRFGNCPRRGHGRFGFGAGPSFHSHMHRHGESEPMDADYTGFNDCFHKQKKARLQDPAIEKDLLVTLEELYHGCVKKIKITKQVLNNDGLTTRNHEKILTIEVKKGWKEGTKVIFANEGDQRPGRIAADIIFRIKDKKHDYFTRDSDNNILYKAKINLRDALCGAVLTVPSLDGHHLHVRLSDVINPNTTKVVTGKGLPLPRTPEIHKDLLITFEITFPDNLACSVKDALRQALPAT